MTEQPTPLLPADSQLRGLILDWGGVLTNDMAGAMNEWSISEGVDLEVFASVMREWFGRDGEIESWVNPVHAIERGEIEVPDFETHLAEMLRDRTGMPIVADGLLKRMFAGFRHAPDMTALVRRAKSAGIKTALLSNSWGNSYPQHLFDGMFDVVVISGDVRMRKPEERIYRHTLELLDMEPEQCVFVDDLIHNIEGATALGMVGIHHQSYDRTSEELDVLFGIQLSR